MRYFILVLAMGISSSAAVAQSKKELIKQVEELKQEISRLQNEITELKKPKTVNISGELQEVSYGIGVLMASNVQSQGVDTIDLEVLTEGFKDVFHGDSLQQDQQKSMMVVQSFMEKAYEKKAEKARAGNVAFFNQNRTKAGVKETASGLQYEVVKSGNGKTPGPNDQVTVHYTGKLLDGTVFDSSVQSGKPATFGVSQVIPGWTEALQLMKEGDKFILYIPDELAYGERGAGGRIPPYSPLVFEVELIKVN
ncbi:MAG TPA: FKBP-type peptidyl-prolyl cis-trans isomerase [Ohtaekwangia sp.]|nr:FKBP-type peptidyl-prolyl cis-trans isomerase [Ohtaekwangia sp.]